MTTIQILDHLSKKIIGKPLDADALADKVLLDGGHDMSEVTKDDLLALMADCFKGDWHEVTFACSETLCCYGANEMGKEEALGWAFVTLALGQAHREHRFQWQSSLSLLAMGLHRAAVFINSSDLATVLAQAFSSHDDMYDVDGNETYYGPKRFPPKEAFGQ